MPYNLDDFNLSETCSFSNFLISKQVRYSMNFHKLFQNYPALLFLRILKKGAPCCSRHPLQQLFLFHGSLLVKRVLSRLCWHLSFRTPIQKHSCLLLLPLLLLLLLVAFFFFFFFLLKPNCRPHAHPHANQIDGNARITSSLLGTFRISSKKGF